MSEELNSEHSTEVNVPPPPHKRFLRVADAFLVDLECAREMFTLVLPVLESQDRERKLRIEKVLTEADKENKLQDQGQGTESSTEVELSFSVSELNELIANLQKLRRADILFRQNAFVGIVSRYDEFLTGVLTSVFETHPEWLRSTEKTITYKELIELKSIDLAINGVIRKEIETLMRGSHSEQIGFLDDRLKLGIKDHFKRFSEFIEITERRNLFVHTGGRISQQYLDNCKRLQNSNQTNSKLNDRLYVDEEYFQSAFEVVFELGLRISQATYRRLFPDNLADADRALNHLVIRFLDAADWALAEALTDFHIALPEKLLSPG